MTLEMHTTELTASCPKQAQLRIEGKEIRTAETALFTGLLGHAVLERVSVGEPATAAECWSATAAKLDDEGRTIAPAVIAGEEKICREVDRLVAEYADRVMPLIEEVIGVELPVRLEVDVDGEPAPFASHIDKLAIGADPFTGERSAMLIDWKFRKDEPSMAYLVRNLQFGMYQYAIKRGGVSVDGWPWMLPNDLPLRAYWAHMPNLKPYSRKTETKDDDGNPVTFVKGDRKPIRKVLIEATCNDDDAVYAAFAERVRMRRLGFAPAIPDPTGCRLCQSQYACKAWGNHG